MIIYITAINNTYINQFPTIQMNKRKSTEQHDNKVRRRLFDSFESAVMPDNPSGDLSRDLSGDLSRNLSGDLSRNLSGDLSRDLSNGRNFAISFLRSYTMDILELPHEIIDLLGYFINTRYLSLLSKKFYIHFNSKNKLMVSRYLQKIKKVTYRSLVSINSCVHEIKIPIEGFHNYLIDTIKYLKKIKSNDLYSDDYYDWYIDNSDELIKIYAHLINNVYVLLSRWSFKNRQSQILLLIKHFVEDKYFKFVLTKNINGITCQYSIDIFDNFESYNLVTLYFACPTKPEFFSINNEISIPIKLGINPDIWKMFIYKLLFLWGDNIMVDPPLEVDFDDSIRTYYLGGDIFRLPPDQTDNVSINNFANDRNIPTDIHENFLELKENKYITPIIELLKNYFYRSIYILLDSDYFNLVILTADLSNENDLTKHNSLSYTINLICTIMNNIKNMHKSQNAQATIIKENILNILNKPLPDLGKNFMIFYQFLYDCISNHLQTYTVTTN